MNTKYLLLYIMLITIDQLIKHFNLNITGVLHIGAHECEELNAYNNSGITNNNIYWVEAMQDKVDFNINKYGKDLNIYQAVIYDENDKEIVFNITNNGESSSVLEFGSHEINHPQVHVVRKETLKTIRLDTLIENNKIPIEHLNFINLDIQGVELRALKSMEKYLPHVKYIYTEVNTEQVYKGCDEITDIDEYLDKFGFKRATAKIYDRLGWGDAFYIKIK
jgi:FkbM family methyltransferase